MQMDAAHTHNGANAQGQRQDTDGAIADVSGIEDQEVRTSGRCYGCGPELVPRQPRWIAACGPVGNPYIGPKAMVNVTANDS